MRKHYTFLLLTLLPLFFIETGCARRSGSEVWDDTYSASRYMNQGIRKLGGKHGDSKQVRSKDDFCRNNYSYRDDFTPLQDDEGRDIVSMETMQQSPFTPGDANSPIPGIEAFNDPDRDPRLSSIFQHIHFPYDSDKVQGQDNLAAAENIANYLKDHPSTYVFLEGHCDERGPQAYNLALGARRANTVRTVLVAEGVEPERLFTVSYGKERPLVDGHDDSAWSLNRRVQFKIYETK